MHPELDLERLKVQLAEWGAPIKVIHSKAGDRTIFLQRPEWGRLPDDASKKMLQETVSHPSPDTRHRVCFCRWPFWHSRHAACCAIDQAVDARLEAERLTITPTIIALQSRVALGYHVGHILGARLVVMLIGERPGFQRRRQPRGIPHLSGKTRHHRRGPELHIQYPS